MNWPLFICGVAFIIMGVAVLISLCASYEASRPTPPLSTLNSPLSTARVYRLPGETDSDLADRLLNASPYHREELKEGK